MPKLTGEELSKLYPRAKTYDELQQEKELRQLAQRPKLAAEKIAFCVALGVLTVFTVYTLVSRVAGSFSDGSVEATMTGVCLAMLLVLFGAAILYSIYKTIDGLVSKTIVTTPQFYTLLGGVAFATGLVAALCKQLDTLLLLATCTVFASTSTYVGTRLIMRRQ